MKRLTLTYRGEKIISSIFNLGAYRIMTDRLSQDKLTQAAHDSAAHEAVVFMFDGTKITASALADRSEIDTDELMAAYDAVRRWCSAVRAKPVNKRMVGTPPEDPILCMYKKLLVNSGVLPDELDRQDPQLFLDVWCADEGDMVSADEIPDSCRDLYGL